MSSGTLNPPEGLQRVLALAAREGGRRLFVTFFESRDEIAAAEARFETMGGEFPEDVRGRRTAADVYEVAWDQAP